MSKSEKKLKGLDLLLAVKHELGSVIEVNSISEVELYRAAQQLIEISRQEFVEVEFREQAQRANYFTHAVDTAVTTMQSSLWRNELSHWQDENDPTRFCAKGKDAMLMHHRHFLAGRFDV